MYKLLRRCIITIYFWIVILICNILAVIIIIPSWLYGSSEKNIRYTIETVIGKYTSLLMELVGIWKITYIDNRTNRDDYIGSYVIVSNHQSLIDTIFTAQIPYDKVFTWKKKWSYAPMFGQLCLLGNHITIDPSDPISKKNAIIKSVKYLNEETSIMFYPEGTRNKTNNNLLPFKTGAFRVANKSNRSILPITIIGTRKACDGVVCDVADIIVIIDNPISGKDIDICIAKTRSVMDNNINNWGLKFL